MSKYVSLVQLQMLLYPNIPISKYAHMQICKICFSCAKRQQLLYHLLYCFELEFARDLADWLGSRMIKCDDDEPGQELWKLPLEPFCWFLHDFTSEPDNERRYGKSFKGWKMHKRIAVNIRRVANGPALWHPTISKRRKRPGGGRAASSSGPSPGGPGPEEQLFHIFYILILHFASMLEVK